MSQYLPDHNRPLPSREKLRKEMYAERDRGFIYWRELDDGRAIGVMPATFDRAVLGIGRADAQAFDDVWDYPSVPRAIAVAIDWDPPREPEPDGWDRHASTNRYRPDGDPRREYTKETDR